MYLNNCYKLLVFLLMAVARNEGAEYKITEQVFFDVDINGEESGRIILGLFGEVAPRTVKNFKEIAVNGIDGKTYKDTKFFRAIRKVMIQGGDILGNDGSGSISIYGDFFEDESFEVKPDSAGLLVMANRGVPNTNGCQFLITTMPTPWLENTNVVFGKVVKGMEFVHKIELLKTNVNDIILSEAVIFKTGIIDTKPFYEESRNYELTLWAWVKAGWLPLSFSFAVMGFFQYLLMQLNKFG